MIQKGKITEKGIWILALVVMMFGLLAISGVQSGYIISSSQTNLITGQAVNPSPPPLGVTYAVSNCTQLQNINDSLNAGYALSTDIDCTGIAFEPIGTSVNPFIGNLIGNSHVIRNLNISKDVFSDHDVALFAFVDGATITDLVIENATIDGYNGVAILASNVYNSTIDSVYVSGTVQFRSMLVYDKGAGGLVYVLNDSVLQYSGANVVLSRGTITGAICSKIGGLVGWSIDSQIDDSYSRGSFGNSMGTTSGGFIGQSDYTDIENVYANFDVSSSLQKFGFAGLITGGSVTSSYYDSTIAGAVSSCGSALCGTAKTTSQMQTQSTFENTGWDFGSTWNLQSNNYPYLQEMDSDLNISLQSPADAATLSGNASESFSYIVDDPFDLEEYYECELFIDSTSVASDDVDECVSNILSINPEINGYYDWYIGCLSPSGATTSSTTRSAYFDAAAPIITLYEPDDGGTVSDSSIDFSYKVSDIAPGPSFDCDLVINGSIEDSATPVNDTNDNMSYLFMLDAYYEWYVTCEDANGNIGNSSTRGLNVNVGPDAPHIIDYVATTTDATIDIIGHLDINASINASANNGIDISTNGSDTELGQAALLETRVIDAVYLDNKSFDVYGLIGDLAASNYVNFENHNQSYYLYYEIANVTAAGASTWKVTLNETVEDTISVAESIYIYNRSKPTGWFNFTLGLLSGINNVQVWGTNQGVAGDATSFIIGYDEFPPTFNFTETIYQPNISASGYYPTFIVEDETSLNLSSIIVNLTDGVTNYYPTLTYNEIVANKEYEYTFNLSAIPEGDYNATFYVEDQASQSNTSTLTNFTILRTLTTDFVIEDEGATTNNTYIYANWSQPLPTPLQEGYFELAVFDDFGVNQTPWVAVDNETFNYTFTMSAYPTILYGEGYYVWIVPYDALNNSGDTETTNGILIEDLTAPILHGSVRIVPDASTYSRASESFHLQWNFTDNETGISTYEYAIGTELYPVPGWNNILSISNTLDDDFVQTELTLEDGEEYYIAVRAKNAYPFANVWTGWNVPTSAVMVDRIPPVGAAIAYQTGPRTIDSINVTFNTGVDTISGMSHATLLKDESLLSEGVCTGFTGSYVTETNLSIGLESYNVLNLDSGKCYTFKLVVYDNAGNSAEDSGGINYNVSVDISPPTAMTITDDGFLTPDTNIDFSWTGGDDPQSGIDHYSYSLGTLSNPISIFNWTEHTGSMNSISFTGLPLVDTETYYFCVRAYNGYNLPTEDCSNGILYLDLITPDALEVISVGWDGTDPYIDSTEGVNWTEITLSGEVGLSCVWSMYDEYYIDVYMDVNTSPTVGSCNKTLYMPSEYHCNVTGLSEGENDVYVMCSDLAGNGQTNTGNTDITFAKDMGGPVVEITYPVNDGDVIPGVETNITFSLLDASTIYSRQYNLYSVANGSLLTYGNFNNAESLLLDLSLYSGEVNLTVYVTDILSRETIKSRTFVINHGEPYVDTSNGNASNYVSEMFYANQAFNLSAEMYFFNNYSYEITNPSDDVIQSDSGSNSTLTNHSSMNILINATGPYTVDGEYLLTLNVSNSSGSYYVITRPIILDRISPTAINDTCDVRVGQDCIETEDLHEVDSDVNAFIIWQDEYGIDSTQIMIEYDTSNQTAYEQNLSAENTTDGTLIYPNSERYFVELDDLLKTNKTISYTWHGFDLAGNEKNETKSFFVNNSVPYITVNGTLDWGLEEEAYAIVVPFIDADPSQQFNNYFNASVNDTNFTIDCSIYGACVLSNVSALSPGNYSLDINITDLNETGGIALSTSDDGPVYVYIYDSINHILHLDTSSAVSASMRYGTTERKADSGTGTEDLEFLVRSDQDHNLVLTVDDFYVQVRSVDLSDTATFTVEKINPDWVNDTNVTFWEDYTIHSVFGAELNYSNGTTYWVGFNLTELGLVHSSNMVIFKYEDYDIGAGTINYSSGLNPISGISLDDVRYWATNNFSIFILATQGTYVPPVEEEEDSHGGGGSSGGGSYYVTRSLAVANCTDGIKNQDETGIDCGGVCDACTVEEEEEETQTTTTPPAQSQPVLPEDVIDTTQDAEETVVKESKLGNMVLWFLIIFVALGAIILFIAKSRQRHSDAVVGGAIEDITGKPADNNPLHIALYVREQRPKYKDEVIKQFLLQHEYDEENIDAAVNALDDKKHISMVKAYLKQYIADGFDMEELAAWLVGQGNDATVVALAKAEFAEDN